MNFFGFGARVARGFVGRDDHGRDGQQDSDLGRCCATIAKFEVLRPKP
jgi:hypothetical protein